MDWKMAASVFAMVFIAELGDKTQLATLNFATQSESKLAVLVGAGLALFATTLLAVLLGNKIAEYIPKYYMQVGSGALFIVLGVWYIISAKG